MSQTLRAFIHAGHSFYFTSGSTVSFLLLLGYVYIFAATNELLNTLRRMRHFLVMSRSWLCIKHIYSICINIIVFVFLLSQP